MADFSETCQKSLKSIKQFLEKANANTPEVDQRLESVNEVVAILSSLIQDEVVGVDQRWPEFARNLPLDKADYNGLSLNFFQWAENPTESR